MSKIKLSVSRNENITLKKRVQDLRRDKLLHLQILNDLVRTMYYKIIITATTTIFYDIIALY